MKKSILVCALATGFLMTSCDKGDDNFQSATGTEQANAKLRYALNGQQSVAEWKGAGPGAVHDGSFAVTSHDIEVVNGKIKGGTFVIPIASIQNFDLPEQVKPILLDHLKSPDFFNILVHPEAQFSIKRVTPLPHPPAGAVAGANYQATGDFTLLGQTHELSFPAKITVDGTGLAVEATFTIDRTKWGMNYAADPALGEHHIYPNVDLHLKLTGTKQ